MLDNKFLEDVKAAASDHQKTRQQVIRASDEIRNASKRAIFAMHRDDLDGADALLSAAVKGLADVRAMAAEVPKMLEEGSYKSALEEYVEARLYRDQLDGQSVGAVEVEGLNVPYDVYLGGLSDLVGELQRRQVKLATAGDMEGVKKIRDTMEEIIGVMMEMDLTGYLRNKFDQSKNSFRRAEEVLYDMTVRRS
jgi:predicted translin family RNA/ssDNA-binding protein